MSETTDDTDETDDAPTAESTNGEPTATAGESTIDGNTGERGGDAGGDPDPGGDDGGEGTDDRWDGGRDTVRYLNYLVLVALVVLALVAGIQFYGAVSRTIDQWVAAEYRSLFHGAFNLAVLLIAAAGISLQVRRVTT